MPLLQAIDQYISKNLIDFSPISPERQALLRQLTDYVASKKGGNVCLNFICTHNSRRSHISQLWAQTAAEYYGLSNVTCFSGGTEATAFNPRSVRAMREVGFAITQLSDDSNPRYEVSYSEGQSVLAYSKAFDAPENPSTQFCAIMTCTHADVNCPYIPGAEKRISLPYNDPKDFDDTPREAAEYAARVQQIGVELFYAFSLVQPNH